MPTANNQKLNRNEGQSKQNYTAKSIGNDKGSLKFGQIDKKGAVTSGVKLDTPDGRHQFNLEIDGKRKGWTSSTSPGNFQVECGSDNVEADSTCVIDAVNGDIIITAHNGKPYYGAVFYENGTRYAGYYDTPGQKVQIYDTLIESINAQVITSPSAIQRQGTDINSNNSRLNIPGTPDNLT